MIHRIALLGGAIAATAILALALGAGSLFARSERAIDSVGQPAPTAAPMERTQVDTVYVKPAPTQQVVRVTRTNPPSTGRHTPRIVVIDRSRHGGGDEGESHGDGGEGGDD